jgi:hypothetical protein
MGSRVSKSLPLMKKGGVITPIIGFAFGPDLKRKAPHIPTFIVWILNFIGVVFSGGREDMEWSSVHTS